MLNTNKSIVIVTGPQRSGTRIGAKILSHDLGYKYIDESEFKISNEELFFNLLKNKKNIVVQAPAMFYKIKDFPKDILVVIMMRNIKDIKASEKRINWKGKIPEQNRLKTNHHPAEAKYRIWKEIKHDLNYHELYYEDLKDHKLWIPKEKRKNFGANQTKA